MDFNNVIEEKILSASAVLDELPMSEASARVLMLERLLRNVIANLQAMLADIEAGCSWAEMGIFGDNEISDILEGFETEISSLKSLIQTAKMLER